jgi:hypothetical protein
VAEGYIIWFVRVWFPHQDYKENVAEGQMLVACVEKKTEEKNIKKDVGLLILADSLVA